MNDSFTEFSRERKKVKFPGQRKDEKVMLIVRKHRVVLLPYVLHIVLMLLLPPILYIFIVPFVLPAFLEPPYSRLFILLSSIYYGFVWIIAFAIWVDYYLDLWIITDQRILDVEQVGFFNRVVSELDLRRIQDITSQVHGMLPTIFGFGNICIQTAAEKERFTMESVPHPVKLRREITRLYKKALEKN